MSDHALRLMVPFGPDGASDRVARLVGRALAARLGANLAIDNLPGDSGLKGFAAAQAWPAEATLVLGTTSTHAIVPALRAAPEPDPAAFVPLALAGFAPNLLLARRGLAGSVADVIERARRAPGTLTYASAGAGQTIHLCGALFGRLAGVQLVHRPYAAGSRAGLEALARGEVDLMFDNVAAALDMVRSGEVQALAVAGDARFPLLPHLPALGDTLPGYAADIWLGLFALPDAPAAQVAAWSAGLSAALGDAAVRDALAALGVAADGRSGPDFARAIADNARQWHHIANACGLTAS